MQDIMRIVNEGILDRKEEIDREKRLGTAIEINGKCKTKTRSEYNYSRWLKLQLYK
jgi:hypothetical protein